MLSFSISSQHLFAVSSIRIRVNHPRSVTYSTLVIFLDFLIEFFLVFLSGFKFLCILQNLLWTHYLPPAFKLISNHIVNHLASTALLLSSEIYGNQGLNVLTISSYLPIAGSLRSINGSFFQEFYALNFLILSRNHQEVQDFPKMRVFLYSIIFNPRN